MLPSLDSNLSFLFKDDFFFFDSLHGNEGLLLRKCLQRAPTTVDKFTIWVQSNPSSHNHNWQQPNICVVSFVLFFVPYLTANNSPCRCDIHETKWLRSLTHTRHNNTHTHTCICKYVYIHIYIYIYIGLTLASS